MVYGRNVAGTELNFEASGALLDASLVMRDRETDSHQVDHRKVATTFIMTNVPSVIS